jgi:hypothetical protein
MIAVINNVVAGGGVALWVQALGSSRTLGHRRRAGVALALTAAFLVYQRWRFVPFDDAGSIRTNADPTVFKEHHVRPFQRPTSAARARPRALGVFLGDWRAEGRSYGEGAPRAKPATWKSTHTGRWHTGQFFLIQDERAVTGAAPFDTLSIIGWDAERGCYFARTFRQPRIPALLRRDRRRPGLDFLGRDRTCPHRLQRRRRDTDDHLGMAAGEGWLPLCDPIAMKVR